MLVGGALCVISNMMLESKGRQTHSQNTYLSKDEILLPLKQKESNVINLLSSG